MGGIDAFPLAPFLLLLIEPIIGEHSDARGDNTGEKCVNEGDQWHVTRILTRGEGNQ
jgi:hypothetical protein